MLNELVYSLGGGVVSGGLKLMLHLWHSEMDDIMNLGQTWPHNISESLINRLLGRVY